MSSTADQAGGQRDQGVWETLALLTEVVDGIAAVQRENLKAFAAIAELQREQQELLLGLALEPEWEATEAQVPKAGLVAQAHQSCLQSSRLIARGHELATRADQLTQQAERIMHGLKAQH